MKPLIALVACLFAFQFSVNGQAFIDTLYGYSAIPDVPYGTSTTFGGFAEPHLMDIGVPVGDNPPTCGRPLMMIVHGGSFLAGNRKGDMMPALTRDFAKRGYVTASIDYRLGMFQTNLNFNCNIPEWNCLNQQDTTEWYRACYRGAQDLHGAIRWLLAHNDSLGLQFDPRNIFLVGESAGGFICLNAAYLDHPDEKTSEYGAMPDAQIPNVQNTQNQCVIPKGFAPSNAALALSRPDLGDPRGSMNPSADPYTIRGVGNFYGGIWRDLFTLNDGTRVPGLYMFHNTQDKIVPYNRHMVLAGYAYCTVTMFGCVYITKRPYCYGSRGIKRMVDTLSIPAQNKPLIQLDTVNGNPNCLTQLFDPAQQAHAVDNYWLRTMNMATFFVTQMDLPPPCIVALDEPLWTRSLSVFPNPAEHWFSVEGLPVGGSVVLMDLQGKVVSQWTATAENGRFTLPETLAKGVYGLRLRDESGRGVVRKLVVM